MTAPWRISAKLAAVPEIYSKIVPHDIAELIKEAKSLHPELAMDVNRYEAAAQAISSN